MPNMDGYAFAKQVKTNPQWVSIPFIFLSRSPTVEEKIRGLELGVDDFLSKPIFVKEVIARVRVLLQRAARENLKAKDDAKTTFAGSLEDMTVVDVLQSIDFSRKSGALQLTRGNQTGYLYFRDGHIIDAQLGELRGEQAVYRVFTWSEGSFNFEFRSVRRNDVIGENTQALLLEGVRRLDEWGRLLEGLPPLTTKFDVDYEELAEQLADIPDELNHILRHFDGHATILDVVDRSGLEDLDALAAISQLYFDGLVYDPQSEDSTLRKVGRPPETGASPMPPRSATPPPRGTPSTASIPRREWSRRRRLRISLLRPHPRWTTTNREPRCLLNRLPTRHPRQYRKKPTAGNPTIEKPTKQKPMTGNRSSHRQPNRRRLWSPTSSQRARNLWKSGPMSQR
jgi:DNA-binding response OmpR family regulator